MKPKTLSLDAAARLAGISEEELRTALKDGLIAGRRLENTGVFHIEEAELERYLRRTRREELAERQPSRRVLIIDDDVRYAESLQLALERDRRLQCRAATWGKDAIGLLHHYKPHLCLLGWRMPDEQLDAVVAVLAQRGIRKQTHVLAYGGNTTRAELGQDPDALLKSCGVPTLYSKARGLSELVADCYSALGIER